jgi:Tfp pilus assembly protein PilX
MRSQPGFTLPVVLAIIVLAAILASSALSDSLLSQTLATTHTLQNRAFSTAERALELEALHIQSSGVVAIRDNAGSLPNLPDERYRIETRTSLVNRAVPGYSANRIVERFFTVTSTGNSARQIKVTTAAGFQQLEYHPDSCAPAVSPANALSDFGRSVTALDFDADGRVDRYYAGDLQGRLWRLEPPGTSSHADFQASVVVDTRTSGNTQGFAAPPDVSLVHRHNGNTIVQIVAATASNSADGSDNHVFVWQDSLAAPAAQLNAVAVFGIGRQQVLTAPLTLAGRTYIATVAETISWDTDCNSTARTAIGMAQLIPGSDGSTAGDIVEAQTVAGVHHPLAGITPTMAQDNLPPMRRRFWRREGVD